MKNKLTSPNEIFTDRLVRLSGHLIFFSFLFTFGVYLFYHQSQGTFPSDLVSHLNSIQLIVSGTKFPEIGFAYTVYVFSKLGGFTYANAATMILSLVLVCLGLVVFLVLKNFLKITDAKGLLFTVLLFNLSAIYLPFFNRNIFLGQGSPNVWHSPTLLMIKPLVFLTTLLVIAALKTMHKSYWILAGVILLLSMTYKPSFGMVFIPALAAYLLINYRNYLYAYLYSFLMILPSLFFFIWQAYVLLQYGYLNGKKDSIIFTFFGVLHLYTPNVFVSILLGLAFPLSLLIFRRSQVWSNQYLQLSWLMLIFGFLEMAFLAEGGETFKCANFFWGYLIAMQLVFVFSFIEFYKWVVLSIKVKDKLDIFKIKFIGFIFFMHLVSGFYYFLRILEGNSYR